MKLSDWAREQGVHYQTSWKWARDGKMPVPVVKTPTGRYLVMVAERAQAGRVAGYCRVSSADQRADLERQVGRVTTGALQRGLRLDDVVTEVGSGLNAHRTKFSRLLADASVTTIVVEHRDRAARFGVEHLQAALSAQGREIVVLDDSEVADDLVRDLTEILTSFCARLYGRRSAKHRAQAALRAAAAPPQEAA